MDSPSGLLTLAWLLKYFLNLQLMQEYADHTAENLTIEFDGEVGVDQSQVYTFTLKADAYDEDTETIKISLDGDNVSNTALTLPAVTGILLIL